MELVDVGPTAVTFDEVMELCNVDRFLLGHCSGPTLPVVLGELQETGSKVSREPLVLDTGTLGKIAFVSVMLDCDEIAAESTCLGKMLPSSIDDVGIQANGHSSRSDKFVELPENLVAQVEDASAVSEGVDLYKGDQGVLL